MKNIKISSQKIEIDGKKINPFTNDMYGETIQVNQDQKLNPTFHFKIGDRNFYINKDVL